MKELVSLKGKYSGEGINHEGQKFVGSFQITKSFEAGLAFTFEAKGLDGEIYHSESSVLGKNMQGGLSLFVLSANHPGVFERPLKRQDGSLFVFGFGKIEDRNSFREEILLDLRQDHLRYTYFWGLPGGDFAERSGCLMKK